MINEIDAVGNVKIIGPKRLKYFLATLKSFTFLKDNINFHINIENGSLIKKPLENYLNKLGFKNIYISSEKDYYNKIYTRLVEKCKNNYILNLEEDHFCILNDKSLFFKIINLANENEVKIIRATFNKLNNDFFKSCSSDYEDQHVKVINFNKKNLFPDKKPFGWSPDAPGYFIENNSIFESKFCFVHWNRELKSFKPHPFERPKYKKELAHKFLIPKNEILRPIDDDHGYENSCCLNSRPEKWNSIIKSIKIWTFYKYLTKYYIKRLKNFF